MENFKELFLRKWQQQSLKDKLYWMRVLFAAIGAIISTIIRPVLISPYADSIFMPIQHPSLIASLVAVFIIVVPSTLVIYFYLKIKPDMVGGWKSYITSGLPAGLFLWLTFWTILYNVILSLSPSVSITQLFGYYGLPF
ncbi:MAG: hypothetical protein ACUVXA_05875 [Candidatus Jordarchaeum sp.]|uniref:hypothetical protein n=1 Tax=Candidatus Jordarchaeum sp. TaxID=2823881 RepID=UPI00404B8644